MEPDGQVRPVRAVMMPVGDVSERGARPKREAYRRRRGRADGQRHRRGARGVGRRGEPGGYVLGRP